MAVALAYVKIIVFTYLKDATETEHLGRETGKYCYFDKIGLLINRTSGPACDLVHSGSMYRRHLAQTLYYGFNKRRFLYHIHISAG